MNAPEPFCSAHPGGTFQKCDACADARWACFNAQNKPAPAAPAPAGLGVVRGISTTACVTVCVVLFFAPSIVTAAAFMVCFLVLCWSMGAFRRSVWVSDAPADAHLSRWDDMNGGAESAEEFVRAIRQSLDEASS